MVTARDALTIEEMPLGAHLVMFYETQEEHRNTVLTYLAEGLRRREKILYFCSEHQPEVITGYLKDAGLDWGKDMREAAQKIVAAVTSRD